MKIIRALLASIVFVFVLLTLYIAHINFFLVDVVFYSALLDGLLATILTSIILFYSQYFGLFNYFEKIQMVIDRKSVV